MGLSRRSFVKLIGATTAAAGITASLAACGTTTPAETSAPAPTGGTESSAAGTPAAPSNDGAITAGISYELGTNGYDPMTTTSALTLAANWHTMEGLTEIHPATREVYAALGADMPTMIDDKTWEVALRDGAVFTNGDAVTPDDVVFSFQRVLDEANQSLYAAFLPFLDSVAKKDDTTVTFTLKYPFSLVPERLSVVKIVPKAAVEADAKAFDLAPIGTGAYTMTDNGAASQKVIFERNDKYNGPHPALAASMTWQILPDASTRTNAISSDTVQAIDSVPASDLATLSQSKSVAAQQGFGLVFAMFNCGSEPMSNVKNRQAVMYALDYDQICSVGMSDLATPATCFVQKEHPSYKEAATVYTKDTEKAKAMFAETGLTSVRLLASDHDFFSAARPIIKESLEAAGLKVTYEEKKSSDVYATIDGKPDAFDIVVAPGDPSVFGDDADLLLRWWYAGDTWTDSRMHWKGSESYMAVQDLLDKAGEASGVDQVKLWQQVFDLVAENVPLYPIFHRKTPTAFNPDTLQNFKPLAVTGLSFVDVSSSN
ncbi:ABC transporter substrate-binding protein [Tessaracoccus antarcticus]|uniref:ABC transporter substrate-binding protein n=2 Tax=Tessaracoccus antarcticus TaxID=2479848 RepID=A0A3M0G1F2_9ACTN|nr:ABC transporter substrate-binding protein [Tessaracoccus antarcticus]